MADEDALQRLAALIRTAREERRWTQVQLAERVGLSRPTVQRYETAKVESPDAAAMRRVFDVLDLDRRELVVILGILSRDELAQPSEPARIISARTRELLDLLEDPALPDEERDAYAEMLRARLRGRRQRGNNDANRRGARETG